MVQAFRRLFVTVLLLFCLAPVLFASQQEAQKEKGESPINVVGTVSNHNELEYPWGELPLPRILIVDGQWYFFSSTGSAVKSGKFIEKDEELVPADGREISLDLSITSHLIYVWLSMGIAFAITFGMARRYKEGDGRKTEPRGWFQNMFETVFVFIRDDVAKYNLPEKDYRRFMPYLFSVFMAITFMDLFSLVPWAATATADITVTATLAIVTFFITQWNGTKDHWQHIFWFPGVPGWIHIILTPVEILGMFTKPFALAIRLFANMFSGKVMIICMLGLIFIFAQAFGTLAGWMTPLFAVPFTVALFALKAFVSLLQAYIFTMLSAVFIGMALEEHEHEEEMAEARA